MYDSKRRLKTCSFHSWICENHGRRGTLRDSACPFLRSCLKCGRKGKITAHSKVFVMSLCKDVVLQFNPKLAYFLLAFRLDEHFLNRGCETKYFSESRMCVSVLVRRFVGNIVTTRGVYID